MTRPALRNLITDVEGLTVGCAHDAAARSGVSVLLADRPAIAAADVRGGGPGTRETDLLALDTLVERVDAIVLSGGSVYGLAAADGVAAALGAEGRGFQLIATPGVPPSPIAPAAILYDLANGGDKAWGETPPYRELGRRALAAVGAGFDLGRSGAGFGARAGSGPGGLGSASVRLSDGAVVAALVAVNSFGAVRQPGGRAFWAWPWEADGEFGGARPWDDGPPPPIGPLDWGEAKLDPGVLQNTTIAIVATDSALTKGEARRLAIMAQDGLARAIRPVHTPFDGDVVFAVSTERRALAEPRARSLAILGSAAADVLARAVARGVWAAEQAGGTG